MGDPFWVSLQVRPMGDYCNLGCKYCKYGLAPKQSRMSFEVLEAMTQKAISHNKGLGVFNWHGGEPTLAGLDFFQEAISLQYRFSSSEVRNVNQIQTNGTTMTRSLAEFFAQSHFGVGISMDGDAYVHDSVRHTKTGKGSHKEVIKGLGILRNAGVNPSVIATVGKSALPYAKETFRYLVGLGFTSIHYSVVFHAYPDQGLSISSEEWYHYLSEVFEEWYDHGDPEVEVRELNEVISWILGKADPSCTSLGTCAHWMVVDVDGFVYPCELLGKADCLGNVLVNDFSQIVSSPEHKAFAKVEKSKPPKCKVCKFLQICNNGCRQMRTLDGVSNPLGLYAYCEQRLALFEKVSKYFS